MLVFAWPSDFEEFGEPASERKLPAPQPINIPRLLSLAPKCSSDPARPLTGRTGAGALSDESTRRLAFLCPWRLRRRADTKSRPSKMELEAAPSLVV